MYSDAVLSMTSWQLPNYMHARTHAQVETDGLEGHPIGDDGDGTGRVAACMHADADAERNKN